MCAAGVSFVYRKEGSRAQEAMACALGWKKGFQQEYCICLSHTQIKKRKNKRQESQKMAVEDREKSHLGRNKAYVLYFQASVTLSEYNPARSYATVNGYFRHLLVFTEIIQYVASGIFLC